jgi:osmoprotectant transport system substrate-binding protein
MTRKTLALLSALVVAGTVVAGCGSSSGGKGGGGKSGTIASKMVFGGPPEFQTRRLQPLQKAYGITFQKFTPLDTGGPETITALKNGQVDAADIFTTDPAIKANNFVVLKDPKSFFGAQNVVPLINKSKATPGVTQVLNFLDAKLTTQVLIDLRTQVEVQKKDATSVATAWLTQFASQRPPANLNKGVKITVGSANFPENEVLADIYIVALKATGATVNAKLNIGSREKYFPGLKDGSIDLIPEYIGSILSYLDPKSTALTLADVKSALPSLLPKNLEILNPAPAEDNDAIVVTAATAKKYSLTSIADLAKKP